MSPLNNLNDLTWDEFVGRGQEGQALEKTEKVSREMEGQEPSYTVSGHSSLSQGFLLTAVISN